MTAEEKLRELSGEYEIVDGLPKAYPIKCWKLDLIANLVVERMSNETKTN